MLTLLTRVLLVALLTSCGGHPEPTPEGKLGGDPKGIAIDALTEVKPVPASDADIVNGIILSKLEMGLRGTATVGQVNAALDLLNARIVSMRPGDATLTVVFPRVADLAALRQKQRSLDGAPGIRFLDLATTVAPEILPPAPADSSTKVGHLFPTRFPAAWNASDRALKNCETRKVPLRILDEFGLPPSGHSAEELPGLTFANSLHSRGVGVQSHGYIVAGAAAAAFDSGLTTGANPFSQCLDLQGIQVANMSNSEIRRELAAHVPAGKFIVNRSLGVFGPTCTPPEPPATNGCLKSDFAGHEDWFGSVVRLAIAWRKEFAPRDGDMLFVNAAGNDFDTLGSVYDLFAQSATSDDVRLTASPRLFGAPSLQVLQDHDLLDAHARFNNFPSFALSDAQVQDIGDYLKEALGPSPTAAPNILTVGSVTRTPSTGAVFESEFSNRNPHLHAVGYPVWGVNDADNRGTSLSAPQVAGLASYLWLLSDELRSQPVSATRHAILDNTRLVGSDVHLLDAYAAILSLDEPGPATPASAPIRLALLDLDNNGRFDEVDLEAFAVAILDSNGEGSPNWGRFDLNGDGFTGGISQARFDLDKTGSTRFGTSVYSTVSQEIEGSPVSFDETAATDKDVLCYYAYSALYTGDETKRHDRLAAACAPPPQADEVLPIQASVASGSKIFALSWGNHEPFSVWGQVYDTVRKQWNQAVRIAPQGELTLAQTLAAAPGANADLLAGWIISEGTVRDGSIRIARYNHNTATWGPPVTVGKSAFKGGHVSTNELFALGLNAQGDAVAAWNLPQDTPPVGILNMWGSVAPKETGIWSAPVLLETDQTEHASAPSIAVDSLGTFYVAWGQGGFTQVARYDGQWHAPEAIPQTGPPGSQRPRLAADSLGNVYAAWNDTNVYASIRDAASGTWTTEVLDSCPSGAENRCHPQIVASGTGNAVVVWNKVTDAVSPPSLKARVYVRVVPLWIPEIVLNPTTTDLTGGFSPLLVAIDSAIVGSSPFTARVVWGQGSKDLVSRRYRTHGDWGPLEPLAHTPGTLVPGTLASTDSGTMLVTWATSTLPPDRVDTKFWELVLAP